MYLIVKNNLGIKIKKVAELRKKSESTAAKQLADLKTKQLIDYRGANKTGGYYVKQAVALLRGKVCCNSLVCLAENLVLMECKDGVYKSLEADEIMEK